MKKAGRKLRIRPLLSGLAVLTSFALTGCATPGGAGSGRNGKAQKIYVIGQSQGISFWDDVEDGAREAAEEFGYELLYSNAESVSDVQSQIDMINDAISNQADAIVISPNSEAKLKESITAARDAGITIITINADFEDTSMRSSYVGTNNLTAGKIAGRHVVEALNDPVNDKILVITHSMDANSAVQRVGGMCLIDGPAFGQAKQKAMQEAAMARAQAMQQGGGQGNAGGPPTGAGGPPADAQQGNAGGPPADAQQGNAGGPPADAQQGNAGGPPAGAQQGNAGGPPADAQQGNAGGPPADAQQGNAGGPPADAQQGNIGGPSKEAEQAREEAMQGGKGTLPGNVIVQNCDGDLNVAKTMTIDALKANPEIKVVFSTNETSTLGVCQAIQEMGLEPDEITVIGFNSNDSELQYLRGGILDGLVVQNPYNIGYLGVYYAGQFASGNSASGMEYTGAVYVTAENIDQKDIQLILDPKKYISK